MLEICHSAELILRSYEALLREAEQSASFRKLLLGRVREAQRKRKKQYASGVARALTPKQLDKLRDRIQRFRDTIADNTTEGAMEAPRVTAPAEAS